MARPESRDAKQRKSQFLCLLADGCDPVDAYKAAKIHHDRAIRIACESSFQDIVRAIREGAGPVVAIVEPETTQRAA